MAERLTDAIVRNLPAPASGNRITYDGGHKDAVKGFGCRVTSGGTRSFILNYRTRSGRERRYTIGQYPEWKTAAAREEAEALKKGIDQGIDPLAILETERNAKTVADMVKRFREEHLPKRRPSTRKNYDLLLDRFILPQLKHSKVSEVTYSDVEGLHRKITKGGAPYQANRSMAVLSKMFSLAIKWGWRGDNPAKGVERNLEVQRHRYLSPDELAKLGAALQGVDDRQGANVVRLLILTGARSGEVMAAKWEQFDLGEGTWTKPGSMTKQKTLHHVPLSAPARQLLVAIRKDAEAAAQKGGSRVSEYVFPGRGSPHRRDIKRAWAEACLAAGIITTATVKGRRGERLVRKPSARIHDLRHTYASLLASSGHSLPIIGALLGHSQPATTARYSHLLNDPLRKATETVGALVGAGDSPGATILTLRN